MDDEKRLKAQAQRIRQRWQNNSDATVTVPGPNNGGLSQYSGSSITNTSSDFLGDWRSADSWQRFDLWRVRCRSRQLQRGNNVCRNFGRTMCHFVLGAKGFHMKVNALTMKSLGDATDGKSDEGANAAIKAMMDEFGLKQNFETRKRMTRRSFDELIVWKLIFDGEVILRKRRGFANDFNFSWQMIDPDFLDHNLNRIEPNGNIIKMSVESDKDDKFPVAYWFLQRRPNDYFYNYADISQQRYYRVPAEEIIHLYAQNEDSEQTRGFPWIFAGMLNLWRSDKFQEAALVNAQIGASKTLFYKKDYPTGFEGSPDELTDDGQLIDKLGYGIGAEMPYGITPMVLDTRYPDAELAPFLQAMSLGMALTFGTSYATTTGDLSQANFVSSKLGIEAENALFHGTQELLIENWKVPGFDEELYRAMLARKINLPISKFEKFNQPIFTGHRRSGIQPLEEAKANETNLNMRVDSPQAIVERRGDDWSEVIAQISANEKELEAAGVPRITGLPPAAEEDTPPAETPAKTTKKPQAVNGALTVEEVMEFYRSVDPVLSTPRK